ncbi:hypothetical protein VTK26DRAFT_1706 [Humicola hyalothermophila]
MLSCSSEAERPSRVGRRAASFKWGDVESGLRHGRKPWGCRQDWEQIGRCRAMFGKWPSAACPVRESLDHFSDHARRAGAASLALSPSRPVRIGGMRCFFFFAHVLYRRPLRLSFRRHGSSMITARLPKVGSDLLVDFPNSQSGISCCYRLM